VVPNITAMMFGRGFKKTAIISTVIAVCSVEVGIIFSYIWNIAPGGTIVLVSIIIFLIIMPAKLLFRFLSGKNYNMKDSIRKA
jgi:zinc transport system permease protein